MSTDSSGFALQWTILTELWKWCILHICAHFINQFHDLKNTELVLFLCIVFKRIIIVDIVNWKIELISRCKSSPAPNVQIESSLSWTLSCSGWNFYSCLETFYLWSLVKLVLYSLVPCYAVGQCNVLSCLEGSMILQRNSVHWNRRCTGHVLFWLQ